MEVFMGKSSINLSVLKGNQWGKNIWEKHWNANKSIEQLPITVDCRTGGISSWACNQFLTGHIHSVHQGSTSCILPSVFGITPTYLYIVVYPMKTSVIVCHSVWMTLIQWPISFAKWRSCAIAGLIIWIDRDLIGRQILLDSFGKYLLQGNEAKSSRLTLLTLAPDDRRAGRHFDLPKFARAETQRWPEEFQELTESIQNGEFPKSWFFQYKNAPKTRMIWGTPIVRKVSFF